MYYTGVGEQALSAEDAANIHNAARAFGDQGYTVRTTDDPGVAEELRAGSTRTQVYTRSFEGAMPTLANYVKAAGREDWSEQTRSERAVTARCYQMLYGDTGDSPSAFVFIWQRTALRAEDERLVQIAQEEGFPVYRVTCDGA